MIRETVPVADMMCSNSHLTNSNTTDQLTKFITKGRLQLLETNAVNNTYYPNTYPRACPLCNFHTDTNSHALNGCRKLKGLYTERHDRCVDIVRKELEKYVFTEFCQVFENQIVALEGMDNPTRMSCIGHNRNIGLWRANVYLHRSSGRGQHLEHHNLRRNGF